MKKTLQKTIALFAALAILMTLFVVPVSAAPYVFMPKTLTLDVGQPSMLTSIDGASSVTATSSKKSVVTVSVDKYDSTHVVFLTPVKSGTATIKVKVNGKTYSCKVTVSKKVTVQIEKTKNILAKDGASSIGNISGASSISVASSNKKVVTVKKVTDSYMPAGTYSIVVTPKKAGTANIHVKVDGKKYICKVKVYAYSNPISSIKFNKTLISGSKFNKNTTYTMKYSAYANKTCPFTIKLKKGWKLEGIQYWQKGWKKSAVLYGHDFDLKKQQEVFRNKKSVKVTGGAFEMLIIAKNTKNGLSQTITLELK